MRPLLCWYRTSSRALRYRKLCGLFYHWCINNRTTRTGAFCHCPRLSLRKRTRWCAFLFSLCALFHLLHFAPGDMYFLLKKNVKKNGNSLSRGDTIDFLQLLYKEGCSGLTNNIKLSQWERPELNSVGWFPWLSVKVNHGAHSLTTSSDFFNNWNLSIV